MHQKLRYLRSSPGKDPVSAQGFAGWLGLRHCVTLNPKPPPKVNNVNDISFAGGRAMVVFDWNNTYNRAIHEADRNRKILLASLAVSECSSRRLQVSSVLPARNLNICARRLRICGPSRIPTESTTRKS